MPGQDQTGPLGQGPLTGRGLGPCGQGLRRGFGRGCGREFGFRRSFSPITQTQEKEMLQNELGLIEQEKQDIDKRLKELRKQ